MTRKNILIKISGDGIEKSPKTISIIKKLSKRGYVVAYMGGGKQINLAFKKAGFQIKFGSHGRVTKTFAERQLARNVLEENQTNLQDKLAKKAIYATVEIPVVYAGGVLCHVNGDDIVKLFYNGFDEIYVITLKKRVDKKKTEFIDYPKIKIIGI